MNGIQGLMQGLQNFMTPPQPQQCPPGMILMNGSCLPQQAMAATQTNSPFSYLNPPVPSPSPSPTPSTSGVSPSPNSTNTNTNTNTGTSNNSNTGTGVSISNIIDPKTDKKTGTSTSAIDLISAIANPNGPSTATGTTVGKSVALNDSLNNKATLSGTLASSSATLSGSSTYVLNPLGTQTFVSDDLSKTPMQPFKTTSYTSTFALLENMRIILTNILIALRPFGGTIPRTASANSAIAVIQ
jgi:hypothetical protein